ncbi:MAG: GNAT family N-acetyltransferase [Bacteroidetes bacterium]|nr:GNAT family N-acetyltransferase [Bacteroidota bacterium]
MLQEHWERVKQIYESGIATGIATFETTAPDWENWNDGHLTFARLVAMYNNEVVGWAALSPVSNRCVYGGVAEVSVYVDECYKGIGIGKLLLKELITESESNNIWTLQAGIFTDNIASVKLHESVGFRVIGHREKIGKLKDTWKDNYILERRSKIVGI